jgi:hypothetical protein
MGCLERRRGDVSERFRQLHIEPLEQRIVLGIIVSAGEFFQFLDADGELQRIYVESGRIDIDGIEDPGVNDTIETLKVLDNGTVFRSSAITMDKFQSNGVTTFTAEFGVDVVEGMDVSLGKSGTIGMFQSGSASGLVSIGTDSVAGHLTTLRLNTGSWGGELTVQGGITTVDIADDIAVAGQITAAQIGTLQVADDIFGTVQTFAGGGIGAIIADAISGTIAAGTAGSRGDISTISLGSLTGAGQILGQVDGDGTLDLDGLSVTASAGLDFVVDATGIRLASTGEDVSFGAIEVRLTEAGGTTTGEIARRWTGEVDVWLTALGTSAGVEVEDPAGSSAVVGDLGLSGITGSLDSIWVDGTFGRIGGGANTGGGDLVSVREIVSVGNTGEVTVSGDLGRLASTSGDVVGRVTVGDELGRIEAHGELLAEVTSRIDAGGNIVLLVGT